MVLTQRPVGRDRHLWLEKMWWDRNPNTRSSYVLCEFIVVRKSLVHLPINNILIDCAA